METAEFIEVLRREGELLAAAAEKAGPEAAVPTCPGWTVHDLVRHQGTVHRWATGFVAGGRKEPAPIAGETPQDALLFPWFREGHAQLVAALTAAPPDLDCWHFLRSPSPLRFWARRQAHETTVHRVDAQAAVGGSRSPVGADFAADGVDELLSGFHVRSKSRVRTDRPRTWRVQAVDAPDGQGDWLVHLSQDPARTERGGAGEADCTLRGPAAELYLALWNRGPYDGLGVTGDTSVVDLWRRTGQIV